MDKPTVARAEQCSALVDAELDPQAVEQLLGTLGVQDIETVRIYYGLGDVLRSEFSPSLSGGGLWAQIEGKLDVPASLELAPVAPAGVEAANAGWFAWRWVGGIAAAVAVVALLGTQWGVGLSEPQLAQSADGAVALVDANNPPAQIMIRDARLDELLSAHQQVSGHSALQGPAGFLRNATFERASSE